MTEEQKAGKRLIIVAAILVSIAVGIDSYLKLVIASWMWSYFMYLGIITNVFLSIYIFVSIYKGSESARKFGVFFYLLIGITPFIVGIGLIGSFPVSYLIFPCGTGLLFIISAFILKRPRVIVVSRN